MIPQPPPGQGPIDPSGVFNPPPPPGSPGLGGGPAMPPGMMPPGMMPPMFMPPMFGPPPKPPRSFARSIFFTLATTIFGISLLANIYLIAIVVIQNSGTVHSVVREGESDQKIAIVPVSGLIDDATARRVGQWLREIEKDEDVKAVVLEIETPGGTINASDRIHHDIQRLRQKRGMKVGVIMGALATSGGYYIACGGDHVVAQETTLTGNIGVLMPRFNLSGAMQKLGVEEKTLTSPPDGFKNAGSMFAPERPEDAKYLQGLIDTAYARFTSVVEAGRQGKLKGSRNERYSGAVFTAQQALGYGLIDEIGYSENAVDWAAKAAGLSDPQVVRFQNPPSFMGLLMGSSSAGQGQAVNVQVDAKMLEELLTPRLMYLWRGD